MLACGACSTASRRSHRTPRATTYLAAVGIHGLASGTGSGVGALLEGSTSQRAGAWREGVLAPARPRAARRERRSTSGELVCEAVSGGGSDLWCTVHRRGDARPPQARRPGYRRAAARDRSGPGVRLEALGTSNGLGPMTSGSSRLVRGERHRPHHGRSEPGRRRPSRRDRPSRPFLHGRRHGRFGSPHGHGRQLDRPFVVPRRSTGPPQARSSPTVSWPRSTANNACASSPVVAAAPTSSSTSRAAPLIPPLAPPNPTGPARLRGPSNSTRHHPPRRAGPLAAGSLIHLLVATSVAVSACGGDNAADSRWHLGRRHDHGPCRRSDLCAGFAWAPAGRLRGRRAASAANPRRGAHRHGNGRQHRQRSRRHLCHHSTAGGVNGFVSAAEPLTTVQELPRTPGEAICDVTSDAGIRPGLELTEVTRESMVDIAANVGATITDLAPTPRYRQLRLLRRRSHRRRRHLLLSVQAIDMDVIMDSTNHSGSPARPNC